MSGSRMILFASATLVLAVGPFAAHAAPTSIHAVDGQWSALASDTTIPRPVARREYAAVYDYQRNRYLIFGGFGYGAPDPWGLWLEVWALDLDPTPAWSRLEISGDSPGERASAQWGYDPARQRLLIFGGYGHHYPGGPNEYLNDVWELSLDGTPAWTELHPTGTPPEGRLAGASVYDPLRQRFVGFGGTRGLPVDTWSLDLSRDPAWSADTIAGTRPPGSYGMTCIYDIFRDRMVTFGGSTSDDYYGVHNDVWELSLSDPLTWTKLAPAGTLPQARRSLTSVHDLVRDRMVIFGGWNSIDNSTSSFLNDVWALSFSPELRWTRLAPSGTLPIGRDAMAAVYNPIQDQMVVYGGWSGTQFLDDTQFLDWGVATADPTMSASAQATSQAASLSWGVQHVSGERVAVYRRQDGTPWSAIGTIENPGTGTLAYQDHAVTPGARYGYLLAVPSQHGAVVGGEVWVSVPTVTDAPPTAPVRFGLDPVRPNPVTGRMDVSLSLLGDAPARLDLIDVSGRLLTCRALPAEAGARTVSLGSAADYPAGVYFLRLSQAGRLATRRLVVTGR